MEASTSGQGVIAAHDGGSSGWRLYSGGHFMRVDGSEHGKLARLADVRDWLMSSNEWPMDAAADEVIAKLREANATGLELFVVNPKSYADPLRPDAHMLSREEVAQRGGLQCLDGRLLGFAGVCNAILNGWVGEYSGYLGSAPRVDSVSVRATVAHELWGWGTAGEVVAITAEPVDWPGLVAAFKGRRKGAPWTDAERTILQAEFHKRGGWKRVGSGWGKDSGVQTALAMELGLKRQALHKHLGEGPAAGAAAFASMSNAFTGTS